MNIAMVILYVSLSKHKSCLILYFVTDSLGDHGKRWSSSSEKAPGYLT